MNMMMRNVVEKSAVRVVEDAPSIVVVLVATVLSLLLMGDAQVAGRAC